VGLPEVHAARAAADAAYRKPDGPHDNAAYAAVCVLLKEAWYAASFAEAYVAYAAGHADARGLTTTSEAYRAYEGGQVREHAVACDLLRESFGNPWRPTPPVAAGVLDWKGACVMRLATAIYEERAFTPERLGVLADALEEAGCTDAELLGHLRGSGPHVRGCWALDVLLGKA
jgi:hypothetical protein